MALKLPVAVTRPPNTSSRRIPFLISALFLECSAPEVNTDSDPSVPFDKLVGVLVEDSYSPGITGTDNGSTHHETHESG